MKIQEVKEILSRNSQNEELENLSSLLDDAVNFGTHLLNWEIEKNLAIKENFVYQTFFKNILENVDGISILVRFSSIDNTKSLFRVLLENIFSLQYLLEKDSINRARSYIVSTIHKELKFFEKIDFNTDAEKEFRAKMQKDRIFKENPFSFNFPLSEKRQKSFKNFLMLPEFVNTEAEYQKTLSKKKNPSWYSLYDGPNDIEQLAKYLNLSALYETFYRVYSENIHGTNILKNNLIKNKDGIRTGVMRENQDARDLTLEVLTCLVMMYSNFTIKRIPEKNKIYEQWYTDFTIKFGIEDRKSTANSSFGQ